MIPYEFVGTYPIGIGFVSIFECFMFNYGNKLFVKSASEFQFNLNAFLVFTSVIMVFFLFSVVLSMLYVCVYSGVVMYMGVKKHSAEFMAFIFSSLALCVMVYPSMVLLYEYSIQVNADLVVKVVGSQWYWSFEVSDYTDVESSIYILPYDELSFGDLRLLEVDNQLVLPSGALVHFNVTSSDVIHSFAMPSLGLKVDAIAGILSIIPFKSLKVGVQYGQCSEICGINHSYMPFCLEVSTVESFLYWVRMLV